MIFLILNKIFSRINIVITAGIKKRGNKVSFEAYALFIRP